MSDVSGNDSSPTACEICRSEARDIDDCCTFFECGSRHCRKHRGGTDERGWEHGDACLKLEATRDQYEHLLTVERLRADRAISFQRDAYDRGYAEALDTVRAHWRTFPEMTNHEVEKAAAKTCAFLFVEQGGRGS